MQPLYFLPNCKRESMTIGGKHVNRVLLSERGLGLQFADVGALELVCNESQSPGPGGLHGCYVTYQTTTGHIPPRISHYPDEIDWTPIGDGALAWIGICKASPTTEEDLRRNKTFNGYYCELGDGARWMVPVIRRIDDSTELPRAMRIDNAGRYVETIKDAYKSYWEASAEVADWFFGDGDAFASGDFDKGQALRLAVEALGLNYRFGIAEQNVTSLIDTDNYLTLLALSVDRPAALTSAAKKNALDTQNTTPG